MKYIYKCIIIILLFQITPRFLTEFNRKLVILNFHLRIIAIMGAKGVRGE